MPNYNKLQHQVRTAGGAHDATRRKYLRKLAKHTGRNVIIYYSGWLQKGELQRQGLQGFEVNDADKNGFMATIHKLDRTRGLDLILHTPGGSTAATESLVDYLRSMFNGNIRAIIPQLAMSAGTMIALACKEIIMGKHSSLGPIDPQFNGIAAHGVIEEFSRAVSEIATNPASIPLWQQIIAKYPPAFIGECEKAIKWSEEMVHRWLIDGMFHGESDAAKKADAIIKELGDHALTKSHSRHISADRAMTLGIKVTALESNQELQDTVLSIHHASVQTFYDTPAFKIIENQRGVAFVLSAAAMRS